jgi:hypothetical protein
MNGNFELLLDPSTFHLQSFHSFLASIYRKSMFATGSTAKHLSNVGVNEIKLFVFNSDSKVRGAIFK